MTRSGERSGWRWNPRLGAAHPTVEPDGPRGRARPGRRRRSDGRADRGIRGTPSAGEQGTGMKRVVCGGAGIPSESLSPGAAREPV